MNEVLYSFLDSVLTKKEIDVLARRYGLFNKDTESLDSIAKVHGCSGEWIRKLLKAILLKLSKKAGDTDLACFLGPVNAL
jgi:DNA-directed RNA polymerase sigma subunit (sigma70/sigma32)